MSISELEIYKKLEVLKQQGDIGAAEQLLASWVQSTEKFSDQWQAFSILFSFALNEGYLDKAREYAIRLIEMDESDAHAHSCMSQVYLLSADYEKAEHEGRVALELANRNRDPGVNSYVTDLGYILLEQGSLHGLESLLASVDAGAEEESPDLFTLARLYWLRARYYLKKGMRSQSIDCYRITARTVLQLKRPVLCYQQLLQEMFSVILEADGEE